MRMPVKCPLSKCGKEARYLRTLGDVEWFICLFCHFHFSGEQTRRAK
jgi:hypothetical protein